MNLKVLEYGEWNNYKGITYDKAKSLIWKHFERVDFGFYLILYIKFYSFYSFYEFR